MSAQHPQEHDVRTWLVVGGRHLLDGTTSRRDPEPLVLAQLPAGTGTPWAGNTVVLRWGDLGPLTLARLLITAHGTPVPLAAGTEESLPNGAELFARMRPGPLLRGLLPREGGRLAGKGGPAVPLFVLQERAAPRGPEVHVYTQVRFVADDACFIRLTEQPVAGAATALAWLGPCLERHHAEALFLNNHQHYYRKCFAGRELEHKYTMCPPTADIWTLTCELMEQVEDGQLPGYMLEYRDEFQAWDYLNHLYQVTGPDEAQGYVSFIPTTDGRTLVKRKWFTEDSFDRRESHTYGVELIDGPESYIRDELDVQARALPSFRRVRYDINFESLRTGHVYGIFFDTVTLVDDPKVRLQQCELEYLRSRTVLDADPDAALEELELLAQWLEAFLRERGLTDVRGTYSKLSFLLDAEAQREKEGVNR